jgi:[ribosomal protein S18]-alanine N-acetyltransferase
MLTDPDSLEATHQIRLMRSDDINDVFDIEMRCFPNEFWPCEHFLDVLKSDTDRCWVIELPPTDEGRVLGFAIEIQQKDALHISNFCVDPNWTGIGLGRRLLRHIIADAQQRQLKSIFLEVSVTNDRAYRLYSQHGFRIYKHLPQYYDVFTDGYLMHLRLHGKNGRS